MDSPPDSITDFADIAFALSAQGCQFLCWIQTDTQEVYDLLMIQLEVHHDLTQMILVCQIVHFKQAVGQEVIELPTANLLEGWLAHAAGQHMI